MEDVSCCLAAEEEGRLPLSDWDRSGAPGLCSRFLPQSHEPTAGTGADTPAAGSRAPALLLGVGGACARCSACLAHTHSRVCQAWLLRGTADPQRPLGGRCYRATRHTLTAERAETRSSRLPSAWVSCLLLGPRGFRPPVLRGSGPEPVPSAKSPLLQGAPPSPCESLCTSAPTALGVPETPGVGPPPAGQRAELGGLTSPAARACQARSQLVPGQTLPAACLAPDGESRPSETPGGWCYRPTAPPSG